METIISSIDDGNLDEIVSEASDILRRGGLVAFPTETVYGLGGNALDADAAGKIYAAKGRPSDNPLIVHISKKEDLSELAVDIPDMAWKLADAFWPGPLTIILKKNDKVPYGTTGGLDTVAIRMPKHPVALRLISESGIYIAAPSANLSGRPSPTRAEHVIEDMQGRIDMIIDAGPIEIGVESTIVDLTVDTPMILRPGFVTKSMLEDVVGDVCFDQTVISHSMTKDRPKAPGMKYRHYAPKAQLTIIEGDNERVVEKINAMAAENAAKGKKTGIIASAENSARYKADCVMTVGSRQDEESIGAMLFHVLRSFDHMDVDMILSEGFPEDDFGLAVMNRLIKAAGHSIIQV